MRTIVAGSRHCTDRGIVERAMDAAPWHITEVVSGCARGVDSLGEQIAIKRGLPICHFPAEWAKLGKAAGPIRNRQMALYADTLVAVLYPGSRGTANMIKQAQELGLRIFVVKVDNERRGG